MVKFITINQEREKLLPVLSVCLQLTPQELNQIKGKFSELSGNNTNENTNKALWNTLSSWYSSPTKSNNNNKSNHG